MTTVLDQPAEPPTFFARRRKRAEEAFDYIGGLTDLAMQTLAQLRKGPLEKPLLLAQLDQIGWRSLSIVILTSAFIGMVLALQPGLRSAGLRRQDVRGTIVCSRSCASWRPC